MSYFKKIDDYQTYSGHDSEFHYDFNANSGGGQAFLGGKIIDTVGVAASPSELEGRIVSFAIRHRERTIDLGGENTSYTIAPRGAGSQSMKLGVQGNVNPNLLIAAALMLPKTCGRNMALSVTVSPLTTENYWLRSMWLDVDRTGVGSAIFIPKDFIFEGGLSKRQGVTTQRDTVIGDQQFFKLDYVRRIDDIVALADNGTLPDYAVDILGYYRDVYTGVREFGYESGAVKVADLMRMLAHDYSDVYSGYSDPLDLLMELSGRDAKQPKAAVEKPAETHEPRNLIFFGAPGTGKSYQLNKLGVRTKDNPGGIFPEDHVRRVTFYPDYTYSQFVGNYRPFTKDGQIGYRYIAGPFLQTYLDASLHPYESYLIIIEELNRANPAAVFGDIFQLLDRDALGASEYAVSVPMEMSECIAEELGKLDEAAQKSIEDFFDPDLDFQDFCDMMQSHIELPPNMFIWATMNSADQGVFPMDTAFKRRWDFRYMGINEGENATPAVLGGEKLSDRTVAFAGGRVVWNKLRKAINTLLLDCGVNEDKLLGPFFLSPEALSDEVNESTGETRFVSSFKDKVLLYLYEDAGKMRRGDIFWNKEATFADVCDKFKSDGIGAFAQQSKKGKSVFGSVLVNTEVDKPIQADED